MESFRPFRFALVGALALLPSALAGQGPLTAPPVRLPSWEPPPIAPEVQSFERMPVYDDDGEVIPFGEISALVDPSGSRGATWGLVLGSLLGAGLGTLLAPRDCDVVRGSQRIHCSPREEALRTRLPVGLAIVGGSLLAWAGWHQDRTTWQEALEEIRRNRRLGTQ